MWKLLNNSKSLAQQNRDWRHPSAGFTIIESAVAIAVLMLGLWAVLQFFPLGIKIIGDSQNLTTASNLAVAQLETVSSLGYESITTGTFEAKQPISSDTSSYLNRYQRQTEVEYLDANFNSSITDVGLKKVTVTVFWLSPILVSEKSTSASIVIANY